MKPPKPDREKVQQWTEILKPYWGPDHRRSITQLLNSAIPFFVIWYAMYRSLEVSYALTLALAFPAAGFLIRLFIIQHDCGHGNFFRSRAARDWVGRAIGVLLLTPYDYWKRTHAYHHAHAGDLDFRGLGDVDTITVKEYLAMNRMGRLKYRLYRHPLVLFGVGPFYQFFIKHRYPLDAPRDWKGAWRSVWWTNAGLVAVVVAMGMTIGFTRFAMIQLPIVVITTTVGVWLFYVQHQFESTYWDWHEQWDYYDASLYGSSYLVLPAPLQWMTGNIGVHHVHHMSARIPNYKLQQAHDENPEFHAVTKVRFRDTIRLINLSLWDEDERELIRFKDLRGRARAA